MAEDRVRGRAGVVAVVDCVDDVVSVWWVNVGVRPQPDFSRLCGAWAYPVSEPDLAGIVEKLAFGRILLSTGAGRASLDRMAVVPSRWLDVEGTLQVATGQVSTAEEVFASEQAGRGAGKLKPPRWPVFPAVIDLENPTGAKAAQKSLKQPVGRCLTIARWLSGLCSVWEDFESERRARPLLGKKFGPERDLLVVTLP